jgi:hypothetical protein
VVYQGSTAGEPQTKEYAMTFDMNRTWSQALALLQGNFQLLSVIAGVFLLLPAALFYLAMPDLMNTLTSNPNANPDQLLAMLKDAMWPLIGLGLLTTVAQTIGYLGMIALMGDDRPTVGEALRRAMVMLPTSIGTSLLLILLLMLVVVIISVILGLVVAGLSAVGGGALGAIFTFIGVIYAMARLTVAMPAIAYEGLRNPLTVLQRSWSLTRPYAWKIMAFFLLLLAVYFVLSLVVGSIFGLIASAFGGGTGSALVLGLSNGLIGAAVAMLYSAILVSIYRQLTGVSHQQIDQTFG